MKLFKVGVLVVFLLTLALANVAVGQSLTLGGIAGRIMDPTGAVVPNATVELKSLDTGETQVATTSGEGTYRFSLFRPGRYEISMAVTGFAKTVQSTTVLVGQTSQVDVTLEISKTSRRLKCRLRHR